MQQQMVLFAQKRGKEIKEERKAQRLELLYDWHRYLTTKR